MNDLSSVLVRQEVVKFIKFVSVIIV